MIDKEIIEAAKHYLSEAEVSLRHSAFEDAVELLDSFFMECAGLEEMAIGANEAQAREYAEPFLCMYYMFGLAEYLLARINIFMDSVDGYDTHLQEHDHRIALCFQAVHQYSKLLPRPPQFSDWQYLTATHAKIMRDLYNSLPPRRLT